MKSNADMEINCARMIMNTKHFARCEKSNLAKDFLNFPISKREKIAGETKMQARTLRLKNNGNHGCQ